MTVTSPSVEQTTTVKRRSPLAETWENLRRSWAGMLGLALIVLHIIIATTSPYWVPQDPYEMNAEIRTLPPSAEHLFGTDKLGRDMFSRSMLGGRVTLVVTLIAIAIAMIWGGLLGIVLSLLNGRADELIMRVVDALLSIRMRKIIGIHFSVKVQSVGKRSLCLVKSK